MDYVDIDWELCFVCQQKKVNELDDLQCPALKSDGASYTYTLNLLLDFDWIDCLPIDLRRLDDGGGIVDTLKRHKAKLDKSRKARYDKTELGRKRKSFENNDPGSSKDLKISRRNIGSTNWIDTIKCSICNEEH